MTAVVDLALFSYRAAPTSAFVALHAMMAHSMKQGTDIRLTIYGNALIHVGRNKALAKMRPEATHILFVDDDMIPEPNALERLLRAGQPVISALCTTRKPDPTVTLAAKIYDEESHQFYPLEDPEQPPLIIGKLATGTAFLLIDRATVETLIEHYLSARDWELDREREHSRMHVRREHREKERAHKETLRRATWEKEHYIRVFDFPVIENENQLGEDICLARRLLQLNIPVAIDTRVAVGHLGEYPYGPWDIEGLSDDHPNRKLR
jgi:hypothetical protein